jgi:hypothetical protein
LNKRENLAEDIRRKVFLTIADKVSSHLFAFKAELLEAEAFTEPAEPHRVDEFFDGRGHRPKTILDLVAELLKFILVFDIVEPRVKL